MNIRIYENKCTSDRKCSHCKTEIKKGNVIQLIMDYRGFRGRGISHIMCSNKCADDWFYNISAV